MGPSLSRQPPTSGTKLKCCTLTSWYEFRPIVKKHCTFITIKKTQNFRLSVILTKTFRFMRTGSGHSWHYCHWKPGHVCCGQEHRRKVQENNCQQHCSLNTESIERLVTVRSQETGCLSTISAFNTNNTMKDRNS